METKHGKCILIRHPNFSGMQRDPMTQGYTPARFPMSEGKAVLHLDSDIAISTDPAITFGVVTKDRGKLAVSAQDSDNAAFEQTFDLGRQGS